MNIYIHTHKDIIHMGFPFKRIIPNIPCIMINKNNIILKTINRRNMRGPYIRKEKFKWMG